MTPRVARLSILDSYGVRWTHETFARDLLQNFFDSAADFRAVALDVRRDEGVVEIRGPETFDLDLLAYIGATTKTTGRTAGGFGEGFKICALIGARDFGLGITAGSGAHELAVFFDPVPLGRELCYRVTTCEADPIQGSYVRLEGCDAACIAAFEAAPAMFRHPDNPSLKEPLVVDLAQGVAVYLAPDADGELYYRRQLRGRARFHATGAERAISLAHDGVVDALEGDRDRRDLPAQPLARAVGEKLAPDELHRVLLQLMPWWKHGNDVLSGMIQAATARGLRFTWPPRWLSRSHDTRGLCEFAERQGFSIALAGFAALGMPTPENHYTSLETRPPSPLELARIQVVRDLYGDLNGKPARADTFEVFDNERAAIAGQHLGNKVILDAGRIARGFDAVGGTILHELAHETGGEEDIRFLRRLTNLLGAAIREPEKVRASRRRYAAARPPRAGTDGEARPSAKGRGKAAPVMLYMPESEGGGDDTEGVLCTLLMPPGFPPAAKVAAAVRAAAAAEGVGVWVTPEWISGPVGAVSWRAPGLPTVLIGGVDPERNDGDTTPAAYRLRTYGPDGLSLVPDPEKLRAAIRRARQNRATGRLGHVLNRSWYEGHRERVKATLGITLKEPQSEKKPSKREQRDRLLIAFLDDFIAEEDGHGLAHVWGRGLSAAAAEWVRRARHDPRSADDLFDEIAARINASIDCARDLRDADPDYDDADAFERDTMEAATGVSVSCYALGADPGDARARAKAGFDVVRAATTRVLDMDVEQDAKGVVLLTAAEAAGLEWTPGPPTRSFDVGRFEEALGRGVAEALRMQREVDEDGGILYAHELMLRLGRMNQDPRLARRVRKNEIVWARKAKATHEVRAVYERALAESGSEIAAAARCLEEAARLLPEDVR